MIIQYVSDLHLEALSGRVEATGVRPADGCDLLVLAGDIVHLRQLTELKNLVEPFAERGIPVLYVPGNHEYYRLRIPIPDRVLEDLKQIEGLSLLDDSTVVIDGVRFIGSTLWSPLLPVEDEVEMADYETLQYYLNDFRMIRCEGGESRLNPNRMRVIHRQSWNWLRDELSRDHKGPTVVITHFVPTPMGIAPQFAGSNLNGYFVADCRELMTEKVAAWISGHTHASFDFEDESSGVRLVCNPLGYFQNGKRENLYFDPVATIEIH